MVAQISRPGAPAMTALLRDLLPLSSSCSTRSKPSIILSVASKHSTSTSMYRPPYACSRNGRIASPANRKPSHCVNVTFVNVTQNTGQQSENFGRAAAIHAPSG